MQGFQYRSYHQYLTETFDAKVYKVVVSSGLTCPTRDGTLAKRGCAFCDLRGSSSFHAKKGRGAAVTQQLNERIPRIKDRFGAQKFLAYFQSYTNTYDDVSDLRELYQEALDHPQISGLCIGTRPDCLSPEVLDLLETTAKQAPVSLELGVQSFEDETLKWLERGHSAEDSFQALRALKKDAPSVHSVVHLMFGSPTDSPDVFEKAAEACNAHQVKGVKLHQVMVLEHTILAERFEKSPFPLISLEEYTKGVARFLQALDPKIYVERLYATASHPEECIGPTWSKERWKTHNEMRRILESKGCTQGSKFSDDASLASIGYLEA